jgi:hypothetical protein
MEANCEKSLPNYVPFGETERPIYPRDHANFTLRPRPTRPHNNFNSLFG